MFSGLCAFPLTPVNAQGVDEKAFIAILNRLAAARVDAVCALGSTGSYAYFSREQRKTIARLAKQQTGDIPLMICIGAIGTDQVLALADDAQQAGADALLLPAMSYQGLSDDEVYGLYQSVAQRVSVPLCIYDNPRTTHVTFSDELHGRIASLPGIRSIKIPGVPAETAATRVQSLRSRLPAGVSIGVSGDAFAGAGLNAGCEVWYSVCGGLFPHTAKAITDAAARGDQAQVTRLAHRLEPLWRLFRQHDGSIRVMAAAAAVLGLTETDCLPRPLQPLAPADLAAVATVIQQLELH